MLVDLCYRCVIDWVYFWILIWRLFGIRLALNWQYCNMFSVVIVMREWQYEIHVWKFRFVEYQWDICLRIERAMCVFSWRLQWHTTTTSLLHTHTHTHSHTHTHMAVQQWVRGQVDPDFSGFCNLMRPNEVTNFRPPGGHAIYENIILRELIVSFYLCLYFYAGIMLQRYSIIRIWLVMWGLTVGNK